MKILQIGTGISRIERNGARSPEKSIYFLSNYLKEIGHSVDVIDEPFFCHRMIAKDILDYIIKLAVFIPFLFFKIFSKGKYVDVIHCHSQFPALLVLIMRRWFKWKAVVFYTAHNPHLVMSGNLTSWLKHTIIEGYVLRRVDRVIAQTDSVRNKLIERYKLDKVVQVYAGIDLASINVKIANSRIDINHNQILCVGVIERRKNQMALVRAIPEITKSISDINVLFIGPIIDRKYYNEIISSTEYKAHKNNIKFTGVVSFKKLYDYYMSSRLLVFPTLSETQGVVLLEAMAFGVPVIASNIDVIKDVVNMKENSAVLVNPHNSNEIANNVIKLLSDMKLSKGIGFNGRVLVNDNFGWYDIARQTAGEYAKAIQK